jgi:hypothetical protein
MVQALCSWPVLMCCTLIGSVKQLSPKNVRINLVITSEKFGRRKSTENKNVKQERVHSRKLTLIAPKCKRDCSISKSSLFVSLKYLTLRMLVSGNRSIAKQPNVSINYMKITIVSILTLFLQLNFRFMFSQ